MGYLTDRFFGWMENEPFIGLLMIVATLVLFLGAWHARPDGDRPWSWLRRLIEAGSVAALFLGLLWAFRAILNDNAKTFRERHGRVSEANYQSLTTIWGGQAEQRELKVKHFVEDEEREEIPRPDPALPPVYKTTKVTHELEENSILGAHGQVTLTLNKRKKGSAYYSGFETDFRMEYQVANQSDRATRAELDFPLSSGAVLYEALTVTEDGKDLAKDLRVSASSVHWSRPMKPGEHHTVVVSYRSRGVEQFYYQIPDAREIRDFTLTLTVPGLPVGDVNYPERCLTPSKVEPTPDGSGTVLSWSLDRSVTTAGMGIALPKPEQPGEKVATVLSRSPYALMLLVVSVSLTLLLQRRRAMDFVEVSLLAAVYCLLFLVMASVSDFALGFWGSVGLGSDLTVALAWVLYRADPAPLRNTVLALVAFFTLVYPLIGLFPEERESFDGLVMIGLTVYLFCLVLVTRLRSGAPRPA